MIGVLAAFASLAGGFYIFARHRRQKNAVTQEGAYEADAKEIPGVRARQELTGDGRSELPASESTTSELHGSPTEPGTEPQDCLRTLIVEIDKGCTRGSGQHEGQHSSVYSPSRDLYREVRVQLQAVGQCQDAPHCIASMICNASLLFDVVAVSSSHAAAVVMVLELKFKIECTRPVVTVLDNAGRAGVSLYANQRERSLRRRAVY